MSIVASTQQSRFYNETQDAGGIDIDLPGVQLSVGDKELLVDARLRLFAGVHYALIGRNGVGKSSLLKSIGHGIMAGFPSKIRALYVDQLEGVDGHRSAVDVVLRADSAAVLARDEADRIQKALESDASGRAAVMAVRSIQLERKVREMEEATKIATKRSGARGFDARKVLVSLEGQVAEQRRTLDAPITSAELAESQHAARSMLADLFLHLNVSDDSASEAQARRILSGLGCDTQKQDGAISQLSGGWRIRVALAQALFLEPELLLLDEPTNHLDLPATLWLQDYLQGLEGTTLVVVSHDRAFLNAVSDEVIVMRKQTLSYHAGTYDDYETVLAEKHQAQVKLKETVDRKKAHIENSIQEGLKAARGGDDKKLGMVASRKKKLERLGAEKNEIGHKYKQSYKAGYHATLKDEVVVERQDPSTRWSLPQPDELRRTGPLVVLDAVSFSYAPPPAKPILTGVSFSVPQRARIALVGANGGGKSTLVGLLTGQLSPTSGLIERHPQAKVGVFMQHQVEDLIAEHGDSSALVYMSTLMQGANQQAVRAHLGAFGIQNALATNSLSSLSGGQAVRVSIAAAVVGRPQLLVLDEPSNHLDMDTIQAMIESLQAFEGAVVLVSHDCHLVDSVADQVYSVRAGKVRHLAGGVNEYVEKLRKRRK